MAYLETIETTQVWTCPKTGYYQVICVGGGGGGGGAGFHFTGALYTPSAVTPDQNSGYIGYKSISDGFIGETTGGNTGSSGGSTSFGSYLSATGGKGGEGGGAVLGASISSAGLHPKGGKSKFSSGGSGVSISSALSLPYNVDKGENFIRINNSIELSYIELNNTFSSNTANTTFNFEGYDPMMSSSCGVLSAVSGGGGAGGDINTKTLFITKGTQIPCTIGNGGSSGAQGSFQKNSKAIINFVPSTSAANLNNARYMLDPLYIRNIKSQFIYLLAIATGGGGGGGFTFDCSGGVGSEMLSEPLSSRFSRTKYHYCNAFKEVPSAPTKNGGNFTSGFGYGAGGAGGSINTRIALGLDLPNSTQIPTTAGDLKYDVISGAFTRPWFGNVTPETDSISNLMRYKLLTEDHCDITSATSGLSGAIIIREVS